MRIQVGAPVLNRRQMPNPHSTGRSVASVNSNVEHFQTKFTNPIIWLSALMVPPNPEPPTQQQRNSHSGLRTLLNLVMFVVICRDTLIIRGDGPNGFGELVFKILIFFLSLVVGLAGLASAAANESSEKPRPFLSFVDFFATLWLAFFGVLAIFGACADNGGYCRRWSLFL